MLAALEANAVAPQQQKTKYVNGRLVLTEDLNKKTQGRGGTPTSFISEGASIAGGVVGGALGSVVPVAGTAAGAALGAGLGGFLGRLVENKVRDDRVGVGDAAKEGALSGVLAGPLKLGKYGISAAKAGMTGKGLTGALTQGAKAADTATLKNMIGNKVGGATDNLITKSYRLTPTQLTNYKNKFGEDVSETVKRYGLVGKDAATIKDNVIAGVQSEYDNIAGQIPAIPKKTVADAFMSRIGKLEATGVDSNMNIASQLKSQMGTLLKKYGDTIPATELNNTRRAFDKLVNYTEKAANPAQYGVNKRSADALRTVLQDAADGAGLKSSTGSSFKEVGQELSKLRQLSDIAARQENLGRGSLPVGMTPLLGAIVGSSGGPVGTAATMAATAAANSQASRSLLAKGADKVASKLGSESTQSLNRAALTGARRGTQGALLESMFNQSPNSSQSMSPMNSTTPIANASNIDQFNDTMNDPSMPTSDSPFDPANLDANVQAILDQGGDMKDIKEYIGLVEALQKIKGTGGAAGGKPVSAEAAKAITNAQTGLAALTDFENIIASDPNALRKSLIPGRGALGGALGNALGTSSLDAARQQVVDIIARLRTGAAITQDEERRFTQFLPQAADSPDVAAQKIAYLKNQFSEVLSRVGAGTTPTLEEVGTTYGL